MDSKRPVGARVRVVIAKDGSSQFVYNDLLAPLAARPGSVTTRASHVEWDKEGNGWTADMRPSGGPVLGPFALRAEALAAERQWLADTWGL